MATYELFESMADLEASPQATQNRRDCQFIQDCLNGHHGAKHRAAAERAQQVALRARQMANSAQIAYVIRGLAASHSRW